jgi:hypothetical protein
MHGAILGFTIIASLCLYFLPTIIAISRSGKRRAAVFAVNLIVGWTVVGWIATAMWVAEQQSRDAELARSWPVETDTWSFDRSRLNERSADQRDDWVLA